MNNRLSARAKVIFSVLSFVLPLLLWSAVSYVPFIWHPLVLIQDPGQVDYFSPGLRIDKPTFDSEVSNAVAQKQKIPTGIPANPVYLPTPYEVLRGFYTAFTTPPATRDGAWLHESLWHSIQVIFWGFTISSIMGVPIGILCGASTVVSRIIEPFVEFFRYLPAPAFGALAVAVLGIYDGPKIAIIVLGTLFQQILIIANSTRKLDRALVEAAMTLGTKKIQLLWRVIVPGIMADLYRDQRILLGWAWTYLIVAELIGTTSGITWFITQQARYQHFPNMYAAIFMIGIIGLGTDLVLGFLGRRLFPWDRSLTN